MRLSLAALTGIASSILSASGASATVLTFDAGVGQPSPLPLAYGNRVGSPDFPQPPQFVYGSDGGITPNVTVTYSPTVLVGGSTSPFDPTHVYGDLTNVLFKQRNSGPEPGVLSITLCADPGFLVCLESFDMAAAYNAVTMQGLDIPFKSLKILDVSGNALYSLEFSPLHTNPSDPLSTYVPGTLPLRHRHFEWSPALVSQCLTIRLDMTNIDTVGGSKVDRIGIDNIKFTQQIPTPGAAALMAGAAGILALRRRTR